MTTEGKVWICAPFYDSASMKAKFLQVSHEEPGTQDDSTLPARAELADRYMAGDLIPSSELPPKFAPRYKDYFSKALPDAFIANGYLLVTERFADVVQRFDLGGGGVVPIEIFQGNRKTLVQGGPYFILQIARLKNTFVLEQSIPRRFKQTLGGGGGPLSTQKTVNAPSPKRLWLAQISGSRNRFGARFSPATV